jgi:hypothetical protein
LGLFSVSAVHPTESVAPSIVATSKLRNIVMAAPQGEGIFVEG